MDTIVEGPPEDGAHEMNLITTQDWNTANNQEVINNISNINNNATLLYIAVEYIKEEYNNEEQEKQLQHSNLVAQADSFNNFNHVSPLDPNMSSVARYSPVYTEPTTSYNPVVIHQLVTSNNTNNVTEDFNVNLSHNSSLDSMPAVLCNNDIREVASDQYLNLSKNQSNVASLHPNSSLQLVPENEQEVKLLITDQATGMSYTVSTQELLVESCLEDQQLLDALAPDPTLLDTDLLALDVNTLKNELNEDIINNAIGNPVISNTVIGHSEPLVVNSYISDLNQSNIRNDDVYKLELRRRRQNEMEVEEQLFSKVYNVIDRPVPSRAGATLSNSYFLINKIGDELGVFAKKAIAKQTQFGPLEGILVNRDIQGTSLSNKLDYLIESGNRTVFRLDVSDAGLTNWMGFVRKATNFTEQNLVLSQRGGGLFYTTTKIIYPKEELKVGYSVSYAEHFKLPYLQAPVVLQWPCFECPEHFETPEELQKHLNFHDEQDEELQKKLLKIKRNKPRQMIKSQQGETLECKLQINKNRRSAAFQCKHCKAMFLQPCLSLLSSHLLDAHKLPENAEVNKHFDSFMYIKCMNCDKNFTSKALLKIHDLQHKTDDGSAEQTNHICPECHRKFPTQKMLVSHVTQHGKEEKELGEIPKENFRCPVCYKMFPVRERLQRHMNVHGPEEAKPLQCSTCEKRFVNNSALTCHIKTHNSGKKIFECPMCKEGFDHILKLKHHVPFHLENNQYTCPHCKKVFKKYSIIRKHIRAFHCERKHICKDCAKTFPTLDKLRMHLLKHSDHREFLCADCGKQFKRKDKLKEHCKRIHNKERENNPSKEDPSSKKFTPKVVPTDFHRFIYKCHSCLVGFKRRGMLVNHLAKRHPDISPDSVPELNMPILRTTRDYYCQYCDKVYRSSSKRKAHILKNHPGAALPVSNRKQGALAESLPNPTFSQTVGSVTTHPQNCQWCHKQYASKAKLLQHQRKKHPDQIAQKSNSDSSEEGKTTPNRAGNENNNNSNNINNNNNSNNSNNMSDQSCDETQVEVNGVVSNELDDSCLQDQYKITDDILTLNTDIEEFSHEDLLPLSNSDDSFSQSAANLDTSSSHLYRLLTTTSNGLPPPT